MSRISISIPDISRWFFLLVMVCVLGCASTPAPTSKDNKVVSTRLGQKPSQPATQKATGKKSSTPSSKPIDTKTKIPASLSVQSATQNTQSTETLDKPKISVAKESDSIKPSEDTVAIEVQANTNTEKLESAKSELGQAQSAAAPLHVPPIQIENSAVPAVPTNVVSKKKLGISGNMQIDFASRVTPGSADTYELDLSCADALRVSGKVTRKDRVLSKILKQEEQSASLTYDLTWHVLNPQNLSEQKKAGVWNGVLELGADGVYKTKNLAIQSSLDATANPASGNFAGNIIGKAQESEGLLQKVKEYSRIFGGKKVSMKVRRVDPIGFNQLVLAAGPLESYSKQTISGNLDYDYDTGNWLTDGITLRAPSGSIDRITGSIKWNEDPKRNQNGKGQYEFNLRFNEEKLNRSQDESTFFESEQDEEAFFLVDQSVPTLSGTIKFRDTLASEQKGEDLPVIKSSIQYDLKSDQLNKQQLCNFLKLWLLIIGPVNDE